MKISVVIPTCNRVDLLKKCLMRLSPDCQGITSDMYEVVVSDDSTDEETGKVVEKSGNNWLKWVAGPRRGPASNRNNGARSAQGEWILFIDDDCLPDAGILKNYIRSIERNPGILVFEGCIKADRPKRHFLEESPVNETGGYMCSCNIMIKKDYFENGLGGFDEKFPYAAMEDVDLGERIKKDNQAVLFVREAYVIHPWRIQHDPVGIKRKRILSGMYYYQKHPEYYKKTTFFKKVRGEFRFYIIDMLFKLIPYRGRGVCSYINAHIITNRNMKKYESDFYSRFGSIHQR